MASLPATGSAAAARDGGTIDAIQIDYHVTPFRAQRFVDLYRAAIKRPLSYGATGYLFYRVEEDAEHFVHLTFWPNRADFDRWWYSQEMQDVRTAVAGLHGQPVLPKWTTVLEQG
jgi:hypothetical protein